jgi:hypothetical protein
MWIEEKVNQPLSMAHNVLEISDLTGLASYTDEECCEDRFVLTQPPPVRAIILELHLFLDSIY